MLYHIYQERQQNRKVTKVTVLISHALKPLSVCPTPSWYVQGTTVLLLCVLWSHDTLLNSYRYNRMVEWRISNDLAQKKKMDFKLFDDQLFDCDYLHQLLPYIHYITTKMYQYHFIARSLEINNWNWSIQGRLIPVKISWTCTHLSLSPDRSLYILQMFWPTLATRTYKKWPFRHHCNMCTI